MSGNTILISLVVYEIIFGIFNIYKNITRYENGKDYIVYITLSLLSGIIVFLTGLTTRIPILGYKKIGLATIIIAVSIVAYRVIIRFILTSMMPEKNASNAEKKNLLIVGAGEAAREILKTLRIIMRIHSKLTAKSIMHHLVQMSMASSITLLNLRS